MEGRRVVDDEIGFSGKRASNEGNFNEGVIDRVELDSNKKQKLEIHSEDNGMNGKSHLSADGETVDSKEHENRRFAAELEDEEDDEEDYEGGEDDSDDGEGESNDEPEVIDVKGKEIMTNDKGKGKVLVDSEDDDFSCDSDNLSDGLGESDLEDDLLAEVDLDNILPSRTRKRRVQSGLRISSNCDDKCTGA